MRHVSKRPDSTRGPSGSSIDRRSARALALLVAGSIALAWALSFATVPLVGDWNSRLNDAFFRLRYRLKGPERMAPGIGHVDLTDSSVRALGMKAGDRTDFGRLVNILSDASAAQVLFDIIFPEPGAPAGDSAFVQACLKAGNVSLPAILQPATGAQVSGQGPSDAGPDPLEGRIWHPRIVREGDPIDAADATASFPELTAAAKGIGHINADPDPDGIYRRIALLVRYGDGYLPSIGFLAACEALEVRPDLLEVFFGSRIRLPGARMPDGSVRDIDIPIDSRGRMIVDFAGPWASSFPHYPITTLLDAETDETIAESVRTELDGSRLIVSDLTTSASDYGPVPFERNYPLSGLHANVMNSILTGRFLRPPGWHETFLLNLVFVALLWLVSWRLRPLACSLLALAAWVALGTAQFSLFAFRGILPGMAAPTVGLAIGLVAVNGYRFFQSEREKLAFRLRMERYFAPKLMSKILRSPEKLMSAEEKVLTVLFSDIAGFTAWCTTQPPDSVHRTLNEYFEEMTEIVFRNEGTVDKFIGDGLMAFFGDPLEQADHAVRAVRAAVEMQQAARLLRVRWEPEGRLALHIRVGVNTGKVVVGDMGSRRIMAYTAIGSETNFASRLEGKAPVDGILVSASVYRAVRDSFQARFAGKITAKGIAEEFETWEILVP